MVSGPNEPVPLDPTISELLGSIYLHNGWRRLTLHLTTPQRNLLADHIEAWMNDSNAPEEGPYLVDRWWTS
jgi:hypothetical protein